MVQVEELLRWNRRQAGMCSMSDRRMESRGRPRTLSPPLPGIPPAEGPDDTKTGKPPIETRHENDGKAVARRREAETSNASLYSEDSMQICCGNE